MALVFRYGRMGHAMRGPGSTTKPMGMVGSSIPREMFMRGTGRMIRPMDLESLGISTGERIKGCGLRINNRERELKFGQMDQNTKAII